MSLIHSIEKEVTYEKDQEMFLAGTIYLGPLKAIKKIAENFVADFPHNLRAKKVKLTVKLTKQKLPIKKKLCIKLTTVLSRNSCKYF